MTDDGDRCERCGHAKTRHEEPSEDACGVHRCLCWGYEEPVDAPELRLWACPSCEYTWADQGVPDRDGVSCPLCGDVDELLVVETWELDQVREPDEILELVEKVKPWLKGGPGGFLL